MTKLYLERFFGDQVRVEYHDMADPAEAAAQADLLERVPENRRYYPIVLINGEPRIAGSAEYYEVLYAVRAELSDQQS